MTGVNGFLLWGSLCLQRRSVALRALVPPPGLWKCSVSPAGHRPQAPCGPPLSFQAVSPKELSDSSSFILLCKSLSCSWCFQKENIRHFTYSVQQERGSLVRPRVIPAVSLREIFLFLMTCGRNSLRWPVTQSLYFLHLFHRALWDAIWILFPLGLVYW